MHTMHRTIRCRIGNVLAKGLSHNCSIGIGPWTEDRYQFFHSPVFQGQFALSRISRSLHQSVAKICELFEAGKLFLGGPTHFKAAKKAPPKKRGLFYRITVHKTALRSCTATIKSCMAASSLSMRSMPSSFSNKATEP
jgi:hypothetical protein